MSMTEKSYSALTTLPDQSCAQALAEALETLEPAPMGLGVFALEDGTGRWEVGAYYTIPPDDIALALLATVHGAQPFALSEIPPTDWVATVRRELHPVQAGRFFVYGSHDADRVPQDCVSLLIEAAMAFGTGHHGTTQGCLLALEDVINAGFSPKNIIDVGCGTAVLAMAAAKIWDCAIIASDIDDTAIDTARANLTCNDLTTRVDLFTCAGFDHEAVRQSAPFDLIFANILMAPLLELAPAMAHHSADQGMVILSGILNEQADRVIASYQQNGFTLKHQRELGEWTTLQLQNG